MDQQPQRSEIGRGRAWLAALAVLLMATLFPGMGAAQELPAQGLPLGLNLGFTSFLDGGPPAGPGPRGRHVTSHSHLAMVRGRSLRPRDGYASMLISHKRR